MINKVKSILTTGSFRLYKESNNRYFLCFYGRLRGGMSTLKLLDVNTWTDQTDSNGDTWSRNKAKRELVKYFKLVKERNAYNGEQT